MKSKVSGCLVDAYSTGSQLAASLKEDGVYLVHVQSTEAVPPGYVLPSGVFDENHIFNQNALQSLVTKLRNKNIEFVIAGSEPGTPLADLLSSELGLAGNSPATSQARRRKSEMARALQRSGISAIEQYEVFSKEEAIFSARLIKNWPVVVKPDNAAGSEGVQICETENAVSKAFEDSFNKYNCNCQVNDKMLVQEYLRGQQFMVNAVSINGRHRITEIWREYRKNIPNVGSLYDYEILVPYKGPEQDQIIPYVRDVLDALGVSDGASHTELMLTDRGPVLIESGARMQGGIYGPAIEAAIGESHVTLTKSRYLHPNQFIREIDTQYSIHRFAMIVNFIADRTGVVLENNCAKYLSKLPSYFAIARSPSVGTKIPKTVDLLTKPGHVYLLHADISQLMRDYEQIREWERTNKLIVLEQ